MSAIIIVYVRVASRQSEPMDARLSVVRYVLALQAAANYFYIAAWGSNNHEV